MYVWDMKRLLEYTTTVRQQQPDGRWLPARPPDFAGPMNLWYRAKAAWEVFRGRADAIRWPG